MWWAGALLKGHPKSKSSLEAAFDQEGLDHICDWGPSQICIVPEKTEVPTS